MNKEKWDTFLEQLKRLIVIMIAVIVLGIVLNVIIVAYQVLPKLQQEHTMANQISQLEVQKKNLEKLPAVDKITEDAINRLEKQVPANPEQARLLISLKEIEKKSGAIMASIALGDDKLAKDALSNLVTGIPQQQATTNGGTAISNSGSATADAQASPAPAAKSNPNATAGGNPSHSLLTENIISMQLDGSYLQLITFIALLQQNDRLLAIKKWNLQTNTGSKESNNEFNLRLSLTVAAYTAPTFAGKLKDLPPIPVATPDKRIDPTASDKDYLDLLELLRQQQSGATNK
jgi:Tfp pilus assembly protein PilO